MAFRRRTRAVAPRGGASRLWDICYAAVLLSARLLLTACVLAFIAATLVYFRLQQGPIAMPGMARMLVEQVNEEGGRAQIDVGDVVLTLGEGAATSGLQFRDIKVRSSDGQSLLAVPRVGARFHLSDLLHGRLQPVRITLIEPDGQIIRTEDGRVRFGMGTGSGISLPGGSEGARREAVARLIDGLVGDQPPLPQLAKLELIEVLGANLTFVDRRSGSHWATERADLRIWRHPNGARASLDLVPSRETGTALSIVADRPVGRGQTDLRLQFEHLEAGELGQVRELGWLDLIEGTISGEASATLERDGRLSALEGAIVAEDGVVRGMREPLPFEEAELHFRTEPESERLQVERLKLIAPAFSATLAGFAELQRGADEAILGLAGQFDVDALHVGLPGIFEEAVAFDRGRITARWSLPDRRVEIADARLARGALGFKLTGEARETDAGWTAALRLTGKGMTHDDLVALWPLAVAGNARRWVDEHVLAGEIEQVTAQLRLGAAEPQVAVDFNYSGLTIGYLDTMSPVENGRGTGHLSLHDLSMTLDEGQVAPGPGDPIELAGSTFAIRGFWGSVPPAEVSIKARGPVDAALVLIDQQPLALPSRLGRELDVAAGLAQVSAELSIPLRKGLKLAEIGVETEAILTGVALPFDIAPGRKVPIRAERMDLTANKQALRLSSDAFVAGAPTAIEWREEFGSGSDGRTITLAGTATPELLAAVGAGDLPLRGAPPFELALRQAGGGPLGFTLQADLQPAGVEIAGLGWSKAPGVPASLSAGGVRSEGLEVRTLTLDGPGLDAQGSMTLDTTGRMVRAAFPHLRVAGRGTFAATLHKTPEGVLEVGLSGRQLDLSDRADGAREGEGNVASPLRLRLDVERLALGDRLQLTPARGVIERNAVGGLQGRLDGWMGAAPAALEIDIPGRGEGTVRLTSPDAGAVLREAGFYSDARGGTLVLDARVGGRNGALAGEARMEDVRVRSRSTFRTMLRQGGLDAAEQEVASNGIGFRKVSIPFTYRDGRLRLTDAIATSPAVGLKVSGTVDERTDRVDLVGVLSPAYGLTGALNEVPLLGQILGGEGEGVLAMTFRLAGSIENPRFSVNPLSMLAPGFLRRIFTAPTSEVSEEFRQSIRPRNR